jgi:hypothetical protein
MTLLVNTIEFEGRKAVINSYSRHPLLVESCERQLTQWQARYPSANVQTEELYEGETIALVAAGRAAVGDDVLRSFAHEIGQASQA